MGTRAPSVGTPSPGVGNVALVGHHAAGKTTLAEALLAATGTIGRQGTVDRGSTVCDFEPEEITHRLSISMAIAPVTVGGVKLNLLDTPGYADFGADVDTALSVADLAVVVVSATDGVQPQTEDAWHAAARLGLPRVVVIDKLDREHGDFERVLDEIRARFGAGVAPIELPIGAEQDFRGVIDLFDDTATLYDPGSPNPAIGTVGPIPDELVDEEHRIHEQLVEGIVVGDDDLMARYLDGEAIARPELQAALASGVAAGSVFPVLCCSGLTGVGVDRLARLLSELCPEATSARPVAILAGDSTGAVACDPEGPPLLRVCKILADQHTGRVALAKVVSGTVRTDDVLTNPRTHTDERLHVLQSLRGREASPVGEVKAGDFVALPRLSAARPGDTLAPKGTPVRIIVPELPPSPLSVAVRPASRADDDKLMAALQRLCEEDPSLGVRRVDETHQTVLEVAGEVHFTVTSERLARRFHVAIEREAVAIAYRETVSTAAEMQETYKKQTGGHGQYAVVQLRVEPLARGGGFEFHDEVVGGAIPRQYIPAVERGVRESMAQGGPAGFPVVDVAVTCLDGKHHPVDSSEMSFKIAGGLAFQAAVRNAGPVVLEPVSRIEVTVPLEAQGDVLGDIHARRGRVSGTEPDEDGLQTVTALVPTVELARYAVDLRALTRGRGRIRTSHDHYDLAPQAR